MAQNTTVSLEVRGADLCFVHLGYGDRLRSFTIKPGYKGTLRGWNYELPIAAIDQAEVTKGKFSWSQAAALGALTLPVSGVVGIAAAAGLRGGHSILGIQATVGGLSATVALKGEEKKLRKVHQEMLKASEQRIPSHETLAVDSQSASTNSQSVDVATHIQKLVDLHAAGILTDEEFSAKKTDLLGRM